MNEQPTIVLSWTRQSLTTFMKAWIVVSVCLASVVTAAPLLAPSPFVGTVFNDAIQVFVALVLIVLIARNAALNHGHVRIFWLLTTEAMSVWAISSSCCFLSDIFTHAQNLQIPLADTAGSFTTA